MDNIKELALSFIGLVIRGVILVFIIMFIYDSGKKAYDFGFRIFTEEAMSPEPGRDVSVTIVQGDSTLDVGKMLEEKGLIRDAYLFYVQKKCSEYDGDIKPGFYTLNTSMTTEDMFAVIAGRSDGNGEETEEDVEEIEAQPLNTAAPLTEQSGGEWEGTEEDEDAYEKAVEQEEAEAAEEEKTIEINITQ